MNANKLENIYWKWPFDILHNFDAWTLFLKDNIRKHPEMEYLTIYYYRDTPDLCSYFLNQTWAELINMNHVQTFDIVIQAIYKIPDLKEVYCVKS